ncbi:molybdopterin-dependent oxidoreductase [Thermodesulfobacteriota bacterium]
MNQRSSSHPGFNRLRDFSEAREKLYAFFSRLTSEEVDRACLEAICAVQEELDTLAHLSDEAQLKEGARLLRGFVQQIHSLPDEQTEEFLNNLSWQYSRLFVQSESPGLTPYESVHCSPDGLLMQKARDEVLAAYRQAHLVPVDGFKEPEDHVAIELEFMARLCQQATETTALEVEFLKNHLLEWVPSMCSQINQAAMSPLYRAMAQLLSGFLILETNLLPDKETKKDDDEVAGWLRALSSIASSPNWRNFSIGKKLLRRSDNAGDHHSVEEKTIPSGCSHDCGARCPLDVHVRNGRIVKIMPGQPDLVELRPCARGLLYHYRVYSPERVKYPMKRVGERGEGKFVRISWDEALDTVAGEITRIRDAHGPAAIMNFGYGGGHGRLHTRKTVMRLLAMAGGYTEWWGSASNEGAIFSAAATYANYRTGNEREDLLNARMIILWGTNPAESLFGNATRWYLTLAKEKGTKIVCVDPRFTETADSFASQWIPIRPGTDAAALVAMAHVIITEGLHDRDFLDAHTMGFDPFEDYVLGGEDGVAKTPAWAEQITGVPAAIIQTLARQYASLKPAALLPGWGPGRSSTGEQYHRAASALAALTGNIGIHGGSAAAMDGTGGGPGGLDLPGAPNAVEKQAPLRPDAFRRCQHRTVARVHVSHAWDAILHGKAGGYYNDIKMVYVTCGDALNQWPDSNKAVKALRKLDFVVVHEQIMTPTAKYADILLPACTWCERNDINLPYICGHHAVYANKAIEPLFESKTDLDICTELAGRLGIEGYNEKTEDEWLRFVADRHGIPDYDTFKAKGFHLFEMPEPYVAFRAEIEDPEHNKFRTPSGKIEIFCQDLADLGRPDIPAIPKYIETWEGVNDPLREKYPLQLITPHSRKRIHSTLHHIPWFQKMEPHTVWMNPVDAGFRGIADGDEVKVFNDRGTVLIPTKITARIMPGVVSIYQGAWYDPDSSGIDRGGCANVLTRSEHSPGGAFCANTSLVQVSKV